MVGREGVSTLVPYLNACYKFPATEATRRKLSRVNKQQFFSKVFGCYVNITIQSFYNPLNDAYTIISSIEKILEDLEERLAQIITNVCMDHVALRLGRQDR